MAVKLVGAPYEIEDEGPIVAARKFAVPIAGDTTDAVRLRAWA
jgi:hypothetical protein